MNDSPSVPSSTLSSWIHFRFEFPTSKNPGKNVFSDNQISMFLWPPKLQTPVRSPFIPPDIGFQFPRLDYLTPIGFLAKTGVPTMILKFCFLIGWTDRQTDRQTDKHFLFVRPFLSEKGIKDDFHYFLSPNVLSLLFGKHNCWASRLASFWWFSCCTL